MLPSAECLLGLSLEEGWKVVSKVPRGVAHTGGNFSVCYIVENTKGKKAFLKALDYSRAFKSTDPARSLQEMTESFNFERDVLAKCKNEKLDNVVVAITDGTIRINNPLDNGTVQYLIFELADGDVRNHVLLNTQFDTAWSLRSLHHIATGLMQIHSRGIAHQDIKPSNVLVFDKNKSKLADFGRSAYIGHTPPHENYLPPGDPIYAPPEMLFNYIDNDWNRRRFGCDAYHLGSMAVFFFMGESMTSLLLQELPIVFTRSRWGGTFEEALPYLKDAFQKGLCKYKESLPVSLRNDLCIIVSQLCEPDPKLRGHPKEANTFDQFNMERYISKFDLLARHAEMGILHLLPL
jgi:eukaryotic-like serine/threonine-protein kinase